MLNIVIAMAGLGSRFTSYDTKYPKPLIQIYNIPMIRWVIENLSPRCPHQFIFICREEHKHFQIESLLNQCTQEQPKIIFVNETTGGAACSVLLAQEFINNSDGLMIANCDQFINMDINIYLNEFAKTDYDGFIMTMIANETKWSYARINNENLVDLVAEKQPISQFATTGIYNFKHGRDFVHYANKMIQNNDKILNEFYVAPVYNYFIKDNKKIGIFNIDSFFGLGVPEDLEAFIKNPISLKIAKEMRMQCK